MEDQQRNEDLQNAIKNVNYKLSFYYHAAVFTIVNLLLLVINLTYSPGTLWFVWPLFGWGIGLASHGFHVFVMREGSSVRKRMIEKELARNKDQTQPPQS